MRKAQRPEEWPVIFTEYLKAGDVDGMASLYATDAQFVALTGGRLSGIEQIRAALAGLVNRQMRMECHVAQAVIAGDVALLYTNFTGASRDSNGELEQLDEKAVEVLRRQADGSWRLIIGDPLGRRR